MSQANVRSVEALKDFKQAMITFMEDARNALTSTEMEIRQTRNWLERDQLAYWKGQIKKAQEAVAQARADLHRRQLSQMNSDSANDADQKEALREARRRLQEAEEKVQRIKKWSPILEHAIAEYHSQSQPLGDRLSGGLVNSIAILEKMIVALEGYLAISAPITKVESTSGGGGATAGGAGKKTASGGSDGVSTAAAPAAPETAAAAKPAESAAAPSSNASQAAEAGTKVPEGASAGRS